MFSRKANYAIRAAVFLAREYGRAPVKVERIAVSEKIPRKFLEAIMLDLKLAGVCRSTRGKQGGYVLAESPAKITLAQILQAIGSPIAVLSCADPKTSGTCTDCAFEGSCPVRLVSEELQASVRKVIEHKTLAALMHESDRLNVRELDFVI